jgi:hypothetical protein
MRLPCFSMAQVIIFHQLSVSSYVTSVKYQNSLPFSPLFQPLHPTDMKTKLLVAFTLFLLSIALNAQWTEKNNGLSGGTS